MKRGLFAACALMVVSACAGANSGSDAAPQAAPALPPPAASGADMQGPVAAPGVTAPGAQQTQAQTESPPAPRGDVVVPGPVQEQQVQPPAGDPRTAAQRMEDIRAWDRCVMQAQNMGESDPTRPALDMPEDLCRQELGMANRTAVPDSRRR
ncbi:MAG: hypothetical protein AB7P07_10750 [Hyphomonadaceae bacterium]